MNDRQDNFLDKLEGVEKFPWADKLFTVDSKSKKFENDCKAKIFHAFVMKGMFFCQRGRQNIQPGIMFLATQSIEHNRGNWAIFIKIMNFLKATQNEVASMSADDTQVLSGMLMRHLQSTRIIRVTLELLCHLEKALFVLCLPNRKLTQEVRLKRNWSVSTTSHRRCCGQNCSSKCKDMK